MSEATLNFYVSRIGNQWMAVRADGWVLASISATGRQLNGAHDGTDAGKQAWATLVLRIEKEPPVIEERLT